MTAHRGVTGPVLVGRDQELGLVDALIAGAAGGESATLLISGEAGMGKTVLVQDACTRVTDDTVVLTGACLPMASVAVPFLPLRSSLRGAPPLPGHPFPDLSTPDDTAVVRFNDWLDDLCRSRPVVLVVDDLHWADRSTLDLLMYAIAGPGNRRLAVIGTIRTEYLSDDHRLSRWLADVRRLPHVNELELHALDSFATEAQIADLLGGAPHQSLVHDVYAHTDGNPYLTRLVVAGLPENARHIASDLPADLRSAVLQSWHLLSPPTRDLTRILAIKGGPASAHELDELIDDPAVASLLAEAVHVGLLDVTGDRYWFHHPLTAEVLEQSLTVDQRRDQHATFARLYEEQVPDAATAPLEILVAIADHRFHAAQPAEAYRWTLLASMRVAEHGSSMELLRLLQRAILLRDELSDADETRSELLHALRSAAFDAGAHEVELSAIDELLAETDETTHPLLAAELILRRMHLRFSTGRSFLSVDDALHALRLASADERSWQFAFSLAEFAHVGFWQNHPEAAPSADRALALARACGHPRALAYALCAKAMVEVKDGHGAPALALASEAIAPAIESGDYWAFTHASHWESNAMEYWASRTCSEHLRMRREQLVELGAPQTYISWLSASEASGWLAIGEWRECLQRLRVALGSDPGAFADVNARLTAARLAALQGRARDAQAHLARADELFAETTSFLTFEFDAVRAEVCLALDDPVAAFDAAMAGVLSPGIPPTMCEWLVPLAARSLTDQAQRAENSRTDAAGIRYMLGKLGEDHPRIIRDFGEYTELSERQVLALQNLYDAELGRGLQESTNATQWLTAVERCREAELPWEEAYSAWRAAESLLTHGTRHRDQAAAVMRAGVERAEELQAIPVLSALRNLANSARISLAPVPHASSEHPVLPGLTAREREILGHLVAGRTYGQIARALTISEKTVSSHISNMLRKTGATNRVDLSRLATQAQRHS
ncbi:DNA-binding CsgD family transcriptional regulator/tetratricopeptide (TPR) repeat protein [Mycetocola sp. CAN_C7]|uniref:helix-turn-helix transcriptional regulator n=1 Tax=Mycetocola sp. CAN_C7 TaxID=2787724 RepID=UPI0018C9CD74